MTLRHLWLLLIAALALLATPAIAQTFPKLSGRVVDEAKLLSPEQVQQLTQLSEQIEQASSRQFVVATVPSLQDYPIEDYGYRLGRAWKIGQGEASNGIILLVAPTERKVRIEVGYGLEPVMTDALASGIIANTILPRFRSGDMAGGIVAGAQAIGEQMKLPLEAAEARAKAQVATKRQAQRGFDIGDWLTALFWIAIIFFFIVPLLFGSLFGRRRGRRYRGGSGPIVIWGGGDWGGGGGSSWGGGGGGGGGFGGFSGGGGSFGGGGASGDW